MTHGLVRVVPVGVVEPTRREARIDRRVARHLMLLQHEEVGIDAVEESPEALQNVTRAVGFSIGRERQTHQTRTDGSVPVVRDLPEPIDVQSDELRTGGRCTGVIWTR